MKDDLDGIKVFIKENWFCAAYYGALLWVVLWLAKVTFQWSGGTIADWFQTFGTIAAIGATWALTRRQADVAHHRDIERSVADVTDKLDALVEIARSIQLTSE